MAKNEKRLTKANRIQREEWKPSNTEPWPRKNILKVGEENLSKDDSYKVVRKYAQKRQWVFPNQVVHFISDIHADADAFFKSLIGAGLIEKTGKEDHEFQLLEKAKKGQVIIGGDCLDKGPSNLRLLDAIKLVKDAGVQLVILAGNHDIRTFVGLAIGEDRRLVAEHMFVRMGKKSIPLFREIYKKYLHKRVDQKELLSKEEVEKRLFPSKKWFETYAEKMDGLIPPKKIERELGRIKEKIDEVRAYLKRTGFSHGMLYATVQKAHDLLVVPEGEYGWFFHEMKISHQEGSFLFIHAGMDDFSTDWVSRVGVEGLNDKFSILMRNDPFELYHGHVGNIFRTKYRDTDFPFSKSSIKKLHALGINAIIHGHRNTIKGHRITVKRGFLNFECDTSLDRKTRKLEGLEGYGASWLTVYPKGKIEAYSTDYPAVKEFSIKQVNGKISKKLPEHIVEEISYQPVMKNSKVEVSVLESPQQIQEILLAIAEDIGNGKIDVEGNGLQLLAELPQKVKLSVKGKSKKKGGKLSLKLEWKN